MRAEHGLVLGLVGEVQVDTVAGGGGRGGWRVGAGGGGRGGWRVGAGSIGGEFDVVGFAG